MAPLTAAAIIAQQVGANAIRDGLFLTYFPVASLPYFMAGAAVLAMPAALFSGRWLTRLGPGRVVPFVLGAIAISGFWSLLNERFDPHSAKPLMAKVAAAATLGSLLGGVGAERVAALLPRGAATQPRCGGPR